jgi:membrane protease YdiL (CAAX protease family)
MSTDLGAPPLAGDAPGGLTVGARLRGFARERPGRFAIACAFAPLVIGILVSQATGELRAHGRGGWGAALLAPSAVTAVVGFSLLAAMRWLSVAGIRRTDPFRAFRLGSPLVGVAALDLIHAARSHPRPLSYIGITFAWAGSIGLAEEVWTRGAALHALRPAGPMRAALASALLFALAHLGHLRTSDPPFVAMQVWDAFATGLVYAAVTLHTGSLWPAVVLHAIGDFAAFQVRWPAAHHLARGQSALTVLLRPRHHAIVVLLLGYAYLLLRDLEERAAQGAERP